MYVGHKQSANFVPYEALHDFRDGRVEWHANNVRIHDLPNGLPRPLWIDSGVCFVPNRIIRGCFRSLVEAATPAVEKVGAANDADEPPSVISNGRCINSVRTEKIRRVSRVSAGLKRDSIPSHHIRRC